MTTTDEWEAGILAKFQRAFDLRDELKDQQAHLRAGRGTTRDYESRSNASDATSPLLLMEWRLTAAPSPLPLSFAALLGDVIQNLRAALDYAAWAGATQEARAKHSSSVSFPVLQKESDFQRWRDRRGDWFDSEVVRVIEASQPYHAPTHQLHPLRVLQVLSNHDKHRLLNVVEDAHVSHGITITPMPADYTWWAATGPVAVGEPLATLSLPRSKESQVIDVAPSFGWYESVAFDSGEQDVEWLRIDELLNSICPFVVETVGLMSGARLGLKPQSTDRDEVSQ